MKVLGMRCGNDNYVYALVEGSKKIPKILEKGREIFPKGFTRARALRWFQQEIDELLSKHIVAVVAIKCTEPMARKGNPFVCRVENEAIIQLVAAIKGIKLVSKKTNRTIAKDLGLKGVAKALVTDLDCSVIPEFETMDSKLKEAVLVAWSSL
ncbi:MAG: hypothetical protein A3K83_03285 [Omnitrophica WOR_2 bacterium RBG_13_44_8b]|nr:MAG: hypothetical protein A3K83_03285 [Omnitrophica WOR_2 bacterium RBG_13_44_8b]